MEILFSGSFDAFLPSEYDISGTYMISGNFVSEKFKNPIYIGSTSDMGRRFFKEHVSSLQKNKHPNPILNASWNKHGEENFVWWLLKESGQDNLLSVEQKWLDLYRPFVDEGGGYNIAKIAGSPMKGRKQSEEAKAKIKNFQIANGSFWKGKKMSPELRKK